MSKQRSIEYIFIKNKETKKRLVLEFSHWFYNKTLEKDAVFALAKKISEHAEMVTAVENGETAGFVAYYRNDFASESAFITVVIVSPVFRNRGIGKTMLQKVIEDCLSNGFISICLEVDDTNYGAIRLYERLGFKRESFCSETSSLYVYTCEKYDG